jgi:hypothetical protein
MPALLLLFAVISPILLLDIVAAVFGADSRDSFVDERDRSGMW